MRVFITGVAGFIGSNLAKTILQQREDVQVLGIDNLDDYYDVGLKESRLSELAGYPQFTFVKGSIVDAKFLRGVFEDFKPQIVINFAAQVGVRNSVTNPDAYVETNIVGFYNILEACRQSYQLYDGGVQHLIYASSSSVYGADQELPYSTDKKSDTPVSLYAATKKSNELMAHAYSKLYNIPSTGLRFFTVYGPAGRPDMAYFKFTDRLVRGEKIQIFNYGDCMRDFTYVDDVIECVYRVMLKAPESYAVYNVGNSKPENLLEFVDILQQELISAGVLPSDYDFESHKELVPMQKGDVPVTFADTSALERDFGFKPSTPLREGLRRFAMWYAKYYNK
ncbi:MAG: GDP-mannose 4,6-dehydratase [Bacteroidales bacterium]|nr:GDP-mannose 4,6-dehydratase [Bacteroidales bacterium]